MGTKISSIGFDNIELQDLVDLVIYCSQEKKQYKNQEQIKELVYQWHMGKTFSLTAIFHEIRDGEKVNRYAKNIFPVFQQDNPVDLTIENVVREEITSDVVVHGKLLYIPCTLHISNPYEIPLSTLTPNKTAKVSLSALGYYGKVKEKKITDEDIEDGIHELLEAGGCLYPAYYEEDMDNHDYFVHGQIQDYDILENPYTGKQVLYVLLDLGVMRLPILVATEEVEELESIAIGKYFEGICWLQGHLKKASKRIQASTPVEKRIGKTLQVIAIENLAQEMQQHWNQNIHFLYPKPVQGIVRIDTQYFIYTAEGEIEPSALSTEEMNAYIEKNEYLWAQFLIQQGQIISQKDSGEIYVDQTLISNNTEKIHFPYHYMKLGNIMYKNEKYHQAVECYTKALAINENLLDGYLYRAVAQEALQEWQKAIRDYKKLIGYRPKDTIILDRINQLKHTL